MSEALYLFRLIPPRADFAQTMTPAEQEAMAGHQDYWQQLLHDGKMDSGTFAKASQLFGKKGAMDLVAVMSTYAVSGFYAIAVDEHMPPGRQDLESAPRP